MDHGASADFWVAYAALPEDIRRRADKQYALFQKNPQHPSLQFKRIGERQGQEVGSVRVTLSHRALAVKRSDGYLWFWIGDHTTYEAFIS